MNFIDSYVIIELKMDSDMPQIVNTKCALLSNCYIIKILTSEVHFNVYSCSFIKKLDIFLPKGRKEMFYLTKHSTQVLNLLCHLVCMALVFIKSCHIVALTALGTISV